MTKEKNRVPCQLSIAGNQLAKVVFLRDKKEVREPFGAKIIVSHIKNDRLEAKF